MVCSCRCSLYWVFQGCMLMYSLLLFLLKSLSVLMVECAACSLWRCTCFNELVFKMIMSEWNSWFWWYGCSAEVLNPSTQRSYGIIEAQSPVGCSRLVSPNLKYGHNFPFCSWVMVWQVVRREFHLFIYFQNNTMSQWSWPSVSK